MRWLLQLWCSSEIAWQRSRSTQSNSSISLTKADQKAQYVQQAVGDTILGDDGVQSAVGSGDGSEIVSRNSSLSPARLNAKLDTEGAPKGPKGNKSGRMKMSQDVDWRTDAVNDWQMRAVELAKKIESRSPGLFQSPQIQFPLAALRRSKGSSRAADAIMRHFLANAVDAETKQLAERELWTSVVASEPPQALAICRQIVERPYLDGLLSDACWEDAKEIHLSDKADDAGSVRGTTDPTQTMILFAYDDEFLYLAAKVPRAEGPPKDNPQTKGRQHDADLSRHDRLCIRLDLDRDYTTWYEFQIDQRGLTAESCWEDRRWNPNWYVAAEADTSIWRVEAAIPWREMTPLPPRRGSIYGVSILRTIPSVGLQSWTQPATTKLQPSSFGLLKFD
jgi:hypothetical protein